MNAPEFKIGDRVRIRENAEKSGPYCKYIGMEVTIRNIIEENNSTKPEEKYIYMMEEAHQIREGDLYWFENELEYAAPECQIDLVSDLSELFGGAGK